MEVPGVDDDVTGVRVVDEDAISSWSASGWAKESYSTMSTSSSTGSFGVDLGDDDPVAVAVEHVGEPDQDDVVVVDQRDGDRGESAGHARTVNPLGV